MDRGEDAVGAVDLGMNTGALTLTAEDAAMVGEPMPGPALLDYGVRRRVWGNFRRAGCAYVELVGTDEPS